MPAEPPSQIDPRSLDADALGGAVGGWPSSPGGGRSARPRPTARHSPHVSILIIPQREEYSSIRGKTSSTAAPAYPALTAASRDPRAIARRSRPRAQPHRNLPADRCAAPLRPPRGPAGSTSRPSHQQEGRQHPARAGEHRQPLLPRSCRRPGTSVRRPAVVADALRPIEGIEEAYIYGSWAARRKGQGGQRPVGDIDVLILGDPGRDQLYHALAVAEKHLGRPIQATIRDPGWLRSGTGSFHETITSRPMLKLAL